MDDIAHGIAKAEIDDFENWNFEKMTIELVRPFMEHDTGEGEEIDEEVEHEVMIDYLGENVKIKRKYLILSFLLGVDAVGFEPTTPAV